jgi:hypothetical protein
MDREYGAFTAGGKPVMWIRQGMQLDNGVERTDGAMR